MTFECCRFVETKEIKTMKLSKNQLDAIEILKKHPTAIIMNDGYLTGGVGIRIKSTTAKSFEKLGLTRNGRITEKGLTI